jgi:hypothetical protein
VSWLKVPLIAWISSQFNCSSEVSASRVDVLSNYQCKAHSPCTHMCPYPRSESVQRSRTERSCKMKRESHPCKHFQSRKPLPLLHDVTQCFSNTSRIFRSSRAQQAEYYLGHIPRIGTEPGSEAEPMEQIKKRIHDELHIASIRLAARICI